MFGGYLNLYLSYNFLGNIENCLLLSDFPRLDRCAAEDMLIYRTFRIKLLLSNLNRIIGAVSDSSTGRNVGKPLSRTVRCWFGAHFCLAYSTANI